MRTLLRTTGFSLLLTGCAVQSGSQGSGVMAGPPARAPLAASMPPAGAPIFATELAGPETFLPPLPTAVVILKPDDPARNRAFCHAATQLPTVQQAEAASVVAPNLIRTRWLMQIGDVGREHATDCDFLVSTYDYARAARLISAIRTSQGGFSGRGPYLLLIIPDRSGLHVAGLNGSGFPETALPRFVANWSQALSETQAQIAATPDRPGLVRSVFNLVGAVLRTVGGGAGGLVMGVFGGL